MDTVHLIVPVVVVDVAVVVDAAVVAVRYG
jgi:hypothetical protein